MAFSESEALDAVQAASHTNSEDVTRIKRIRNYLDDDAPTNWLAPGTPAEVIKIAKLARVNFLRLIVDASAQSLYVDGYSIPSAPPVAADAAVGYDDSAESYAWRAWQANRLDARQTGIHRSALSYGVSYATVLPGTPFPVVRGYSARTLTAYYGTDDSWPVYAVVNRGNLIRLIDDELVRTYVKTDDGLTLIGAPAGHGASVCPVVAYRPTVDLDDPTLGDVEPLIPLQDQINLTTFGLLVAQHYSAFRQRYIVGWMADSEAEAVVASARRLWTFDSDPSEVSIGEFSETTLAGYLESREHSIKHLATASQTPVHEMIGSLANLSAEALVAARDSHGRKLKERESSFGESHEQMLALVAGMGGAAASPEAHVRWRDMEGRSLSKTADALSKLKDLGVPDIALWKKIPGVTDDDVREWEQLLEQQRAADPMRAIMDTVDRQQGEA
jgi:hypothetical protein